MWTFLVTCLCSTKFQVLINPVDLSMRLYCSWLASKLVLVIIWKCRQVQKQLLAISSPVCQAAEKIWFSIQYWLLCAGLGVLNIQCSPSIISIYISMYMVFKNCMARWEFLFVTPGQLLHVCYHRTGLWQKNMVLRV